MREYSRMSLKYLFYSFSILLLYLYFEPPTSTTSWKRWRRLWGGWIIIPTGIGISVLTVLHWKRIAKDNRQSVNKTVINDFQIVCYRAVPFRTLSRVWGWISSVYVPTNLRCWLYTRFANICGANIEEAANSLESYDTLCDFFVRPLKEGVRPIAEIEHLVSPADGHIISAGYVNSCQVEQIKGVTYAIKSFLGEPTWLQQHHRLNGLDAADGDDESEAKENEQSTTPFLLTASRNATNNIASNARNNNNNNNNNNYSNDYVSSSVASSSSSSSSKSSYCNRSITADYNMLELDLTASTILYKNTNTATMIGYNNWMWGWLIFYCRFCVTVLLKNSFYIGFQLIYGIKTTNSLMNHKVLSGASFLKSRFKFNLSSSSSYFSFSNKTKNANNNNNNGKLQINHHRRDAIDSECDSDFESSSDTDNSLSSSDNVVQNTSSKKNRSVDDSDDDGDDDCRCVSAVCIDDTEWEDYKKKLLRHDNNQLYQLVVYLAPGDYHRFHSPADWNVSFRRHFQGELLSVHPKISKWIPELFSLNERVVYVGEWQHGFFSMIAVGATNVGSIRVYSDETLQTNTRRWKGDVGHKDHALNNSWQKGQEVGEFRLGSTIVLLFEAPKDFKFSVQSGDRVKVGEPIVDLT